MTARPSTGAPATGRVLFLRPGLPVKPVLRGAPVSSPSPAPGGSPWLPSAPCTPADCVDVPPSGAALPRAILRVLAVLVVLLTGLALAPFVRRLAGVRRDRLVRVWCRAVVRSLGVRVRITGGVPPSGGLLLVANHVSWLDIPLMAAVRPGRMVAKTEIRRWPVAGPLAAYGGALFIDRDRLRALPGTVARIADGLREGSAVVVFPEGSTWCGRAQGHFRRAAFQAALDADVPVQPVRLRYRLDGGPGSTVPAFVGRDTLLASVWRVASTRRLVAAVDVTPVLGGADGREAVGPGIGHRADPSAARPAARRALARAAERAVMDGPRGGAAHREGRRGTGDGWYV